MQGHDKRAGKYLINNLLLVFIDTNYINYQEYIINGTYLVDLNLINTITNWQDKYFMRSSYG